MLADVGLMLGLFMEMVVSSNPSYPKPCPPEATRERGDPDIGHTTSPPAGSRGGPEGSAFASRYNESCKASGQEGCRAFGLQGCTVQGLQGLRA